MTQIFDFSKALIRCHAIYYIMCDGQTKTPKQKYEEWQAVLSVEREKYDNMPGHLLNKPSGLSKAAKIVAVEHELDKLEDKKHIHPLSASAKSCLKRLYGEIKYGKQASFKEKGNKYTQKGKIVEDDSLKLIGDMDGREYKKNELRIENEFLSGIPDTFFGESIYKAEYVPDVKSSWDWNTFSDSLDKNINPLYWWQLQGYFALTGAKEGEISYCLISMPESLLNDEIMRYEDRFRKETGIIDVSISKEYQEGVKKLVNNLTFEDMSPRERRQQIKIIRDDDAIQKIYEAVPKCREYLQELQEKHLMGVFSDKEVSTLESIEEV